MTPQNSWFQRALLGQVMADFSDAALWVQEPFFDLIPDLIRRIPLNREQDVVWLDMTDPVRVPGINLVERHDSIELWPFTADLVDVVRAATQRLFGQSAWRQQDEEVLDNALLAVQGGQPQPTLVHLYKLLTDADYRYDVICALPATISDQYWLDLETRKPRERSEIIAPPRQRIRAILNHPVSGRVFAQPHTTINLHQAFDCGKIVLISLPRRHLGEFRYAFSNAFLALVRPGHQRQQPSSEIVASVDIFAGPRTWRVAGDTFVDDDTRIRFQATKTSVFSRLKWSMLNLLPDLVALFQTPPPLDSDLELWHEKRGEPGTLPEHPGQDMLRWVERLERLETDQERGDWLRQLWENDWPGYLVARRYHDAVRRNELIEHPEIIPDKLERVRELSRLAYGTPHYETAVQVERILDSG